jgi:hypothetical protein
MAQFSQEVRNSGCSDSTFTVFFFFFFKGNKSFTDKGEPRSIFLCFWNIFLLILEGEGVKKKVVQEP